MTPKASRIPAALALAAVFAASAPAADRPELSAYPFKTEMSADGDYAADGIGWDFVLSGAIEGDVSVTGVEPFRVTLSNATLNGSLALTGDAQLWLVGENAIASAAESAVSASATLTVGGPGSLAASAPGGKKVGVVSAGNLVVAGGDTTLTIADPTAKNACGVSLSGNYEQVAGSLKVVAESDAVKQNGVFLSKKKTTAAISGGVLSFEMAGEKSVGLALDKDSCAGTLSGGALLIAMSGDGAKGVKTDGSFTMTGGLLDATMTGGYVEELFEYEDDDGAVWNYYVTLTSSTKTSGGTATYNTSRLLNSGTYAVYDPSKAYAVKAGTLAIGGGTVRIRCTGTAGRGLGADDMTLSGGHFDIEVAGGPTDVYVESLVEADDLSSNNYATVATCLDSGGAACLKTSGESSSMRITGGTFLLSATGTAGKLINAAGSLSIGTAGATTLPTDASFSPDIQGSATGQKVYCCAIKQKYYGTLAAAAATTNLPDCAVAADNIVSTSSGGMGGGMGGDDDADYSNPKGVKGQTGVEMHSGRLRVTTANDGGEGLESKSDLTIDGGLVELVCADDCVNTASNLTVNGGYVYAASTGNDAFDANANITINGGWIYAFTLSTPEEAFDVNSGYSITINGGHLFGIGNSQSGREGTIAGTQKYYQGSYTLPTAATWLKASGTDTVWGKIPAASSSGTAYLFCSVPGMTSGTAPTSAGTTAPTGANEVGFHGFYTTGSAE